MRTATAFRVVALAIAVAGLADPVFTLTRPVRQPLTIAIIDTPSLALPEGDATRRDRAFRAARDVQQALANEFAATIHVQDPNVSAAPCPPQSACVLVGDGARPHNLDDGVAMLGAVRVGSSPTPGIAIRSVDSPPFVDLSSRGRLHVELEARGISKAQADLEVFDGDALVGHASHAWDASTANAAATSRVEVEWTPIQPGVRELRVVAHTKARDITELDNVAHVAVDVGRRVAHVLVYEPLPSWDGTFVRRAIEGDGRFDVLAHARVAPTVTIGTTPVTLAVDSLERNDISTVIVTAPERLVVGEVDALDRFARLRGGSVILLLDAVPEGDIARVLPRAVERRLPAAVALGDLRASELVVFPHIDAATTALASAGSEPVVIARSVGQGRVIASGALDAWRFRDDQLRFGSFWRALVADAANAAGDPLAVTLSPTLVRRGGRVDVDVEFRSANQKIPAAEARAVLRCGDGSELIRLWPAGTSGHFAGSFVAGSPGTCRVEVELASTASASAPFLVSETATTPPRITDEISAAIEAYGGLVVDAGSEGALITKFRESASRNRIATPVRPMRSAWWIVPFAACLGSEWWLRRRGMCSAGL